MTLTPPHSKIRGDAAVCGGGGGEGAQSSTANPIGFGVELRSPDNGPCALQVCGHTRLGCHRRIQRVGGTGHAPERP